MQNRQNQFKLHYFYIPTFFEGHFGGSDTTPPHMTRTLFFLVKIFFNLNTTFVIIFHYVMGQIDVSILKLEHFAQK